MSDRHESSENAPKQTETQLWATLLFSGLMSPQRAKQHLVQWRTQGISVQEIWQKLPAQASSFGLKPEEAQTLRSTTFTMGSPALRWDEELYPSGLNKLALKLRPAILFYKGTTELLNRRLVYLAPTKMTESAWEVTREVISLLLGENTLPVAFQDSEQADLILNEMESTEGEFLLLARQGLGTLKLAERENRYLEAQRLLILSPLPPHVETNPAWNSLLEQIAFAAASCCVTSDLKTIPQTSKDIAPMIFYTGSMDNTQPTSRRILTSIPELLTWLAGASNPPYESTLSDPATVAEPDTPLTPEEALRTLEAGGRVPEALRKRLLQK